MTEFCPDGFRDLPADAGRRRSPRARAGCAAVPALRLLFTVVLASLAAVAQAETAPSAKPAWQPLLAEPGRRIEVDRTSIKMDEAGKKSEAWGRLILARPLPDAVSGTSFRVLESLIRFDCTASSFATLRRVFKRDEKEEIRAEEDRIPAERPVRADSFEDRVMRVACRPQGKAGDRFDFKNALQSANRAARQASDEPPPKRTRLLSADLGRGQVADGGNGEPAVRRPAESGQAQAARELRQPIPWAYTGEGGPERWGELRPEYRLCAEGRRQSPIDVREGLAVDLPALEFNYQPSLFRLTDRGHSLHLAVGENRLRVLGQDYLLLEAVFRRPGEVAVRGELPPMAIHLLHRADDGRLLMVVVPFREGAENAVVQTALNHLPLERHQAVEPAGVPIDLRAILPGSLGYATFMGSLSTPPCTEGVQWVVLKQSVTVSAEQLAIFARRYPGNARPLQPAHGRLIKESRTL